MTITNLEINPYYDDFYDSYSNETGYLHTKGYNQILFKPGYSVQSRELTQLQTIIKDQISKFGSHIFKHGSVVIPGNSNSDLNVCFVKLQTTTVNIPSLVGKTVIGSISGLRGYIKHGLAETITDPATLYVSYYNTGISGESVLLDDEVLTVEESPTITVSTALTSATGAASMASINTGVFYVNGAFVTVNRQSIVLDNSPTPSCHVLLQIVESIVSSDTDQTLLDPAQGSYNFAAPGADRLKIELILTTLPLNTTLTEDFVEIMRYNAGVLEEHLRYPKYNELEKSLARRTYDESGDYVVTGLDVSVREHLKSTVNGGRYDLPTGNASKLIYTVDAGKAYIRGFENEVFSSMELIVNKARDSSHVKTTAINSTPSYGQFFYVTNVVGLPSFKGRELITLVNSTAGGVNIGTARVIAFDYFESNTTDSNAIWKLFVSDVSLNTGYDVSKIGKITFASGNFTVLSKLNIIRSNTASFNLGDIVAYGTARYATVHKFSIPTGSLYVYKHTVSDIPVIGDIITDATTTAAARVIGLESLGRNINDNLLLELPISSTKSVKNASSVVDMTYKIYYETSVTTSGTNDGITVNASFTVAGMTIDPKEQGNMTIVATVGTVGMPVGVYPITLANVLTDGSGVQFIGFDPGMTLKIVCAATKTGANAAPKTKVIDTAIEVGVVVADTIQLLKADGIRLKSVVSTANGDVTEKYSFDNGQRDYAYLPSTIKLVSGQVAPTGTLTVTYDYFNHFLGTGDYFSVDSYVDSLLDSYYESSLLFYKSKNTGKTYDLKNVLDFRTRVGDAGEYSGGTSVASNVVQIDSRLSTSVQKYVGRVDAIVYNKDGSLVVVSGTPADIPVAPNTPVESLFLAKVNVPPYTFSAIDVGVVLQNNRVYTMKDVGSLENRISNIEEYVTLTQTESQIVNYDVLDATTGLSRYKSGYLVDTFSNPDIISDILNPSFKVSYISENIIPMFEEIEVPLVITEQAGVQTTGGSTGVITLPYTHVAMIKQPYSSKITNINPFSVFSWTGKMNISPTSDTWTDIENLSTVFKNEVETRTEWVTIRRPWGWVAPAGAFVNFAPAPTPVSSTGNWFWGQEGS